MMKAARKNNALEGIKKEQLKRRVFTVEFKAEVVHHKKAENIGTGNIDCFSDRASSRCVSNASTQNGCDVFGTAFILLAYFNFRFAKCPQICRVHCYLALTFHWFRSSFVHQRAIIMLNLLILNRSESCQRSPALRCGQLLNSWLIV